MANSEAMYLKVPVDDVDSQRSTSSRVLKVGVAFIGGFALVLLSSMAISASGPMFNSISADESISLFSMPTSLRSSMPMPATTLFNLPGAGPWKQLALAEMEASNRCSRDASVRANGIKAIQASMSSTDKAMVAKAEAAVLKNAQDILKAGVTEPLGFWDPSGLSTETSEGRLLFFREAEIKHGRVCMLAFLGMAVGENFHPLFGGNVDIPAASHFTNWGSVDLFWVAAYLQFIVASGFEELRTSRGVIEGQSINGLLPNDNPEPFAVKAGRVPGDLGFDPLGLKPKTEKDLIEMQNKELNNGRLAMFAVLGVLGQEAVTGEKLFR